MGKTALKTSKSTSQNFIFILFCILLFYPPFFRGLFFQRELMPTHIITSLIFLSYYFMTKKEEKKLTWAEIGLLTIILLYIVSTCIFAVNINLSIQETLKYINYFLILYLAKNLIQDENRLNIVLMTLVSAGILVVFIGIGSALETFKYNGAFVGGMMNSTLQYHNTFGVYCLAILFLAYMLAGRLEGKFKYAISLATFMLFFGFIMSYSRGAWILLPLVGFIYYIFISEKYKISFIANLLGNLIGVIVVLKKFTDAIESTNKTIGWLWILIGIAISVIISQFIEKSLNKLSLNSKIYNIIIPAVALLVPITVFLTKDILLGFLPSDLANRIGSISLKAETVTERAVFYKDAFKIIKDYPILGAGGGAWQTLYKAYQTYAYWTAQAHNYFMQLWIEIGTIGIIVFTSILLFYLYNTFMTYRKIQNTNIKNSVVAVFTAVITILIHSTIDFDLSLSAVSIILWGLMGIQLALSKDIVQIKSKTMVKSKYLIAVLATVLLIVSSANYISFKSVNEGIELIKNVEIQEGFDKFKLAATLSPFNYNYLADYANLSYNIAIKNKDKNQLQKSLEIMDKAVRLGKYDFKLLSNVIRFYAQNGKIDKSLEILNQLEKYHPLNSATYENKSTVLYALANYYLKNGDKNKAKKMAEEVINIEKKINKLNEEIKENVEIITKKVKFIEITPIIHKNIDNAKEILKILQN
ncbi:O-antigen ligase family protein [Caminicella sporogenes]|uniref:O-antigen ligase family protein n=1 Tax=Caminicella sporogenes TaxID=166485 RepID=UPI002540FF9B|nr:O-antigen ligase family protein [Caminicella sporogenes]WIF96083.1 O-antigen ligase family protein [Caminicella sporogenes]